MKPPASLLSPKSCSIKSRTVKRSATSTLSWLLSDKSPSRRHTSSACGTRTRKRPRIRVRLVTLSLSLQVALHQLNSLFKTNRTPQSTWSSSISRRTTLWPTVNSCRPFEVASRTVCTRHSCPARSPSSTCLSPCPMRKLTRSAMCNWTIFTCSVTNWTVFSNSTCSNRRKMQIYTSWARTLWASVKVKLSSKWWIIWRKAWRRRILKWNRRRMISISACNSAKRSINLLAWSNPLRRTSSKYPRLRRTSVWLFLPTSSSKGKR